jgi:hypothetical protein
VSYFTRLLSGLAVYLVAITYAEYAVSQDMPLWKNVGSWQVRVDTTLNYGCFVLAEFDEGSVVRIGFDKANSGGYLLITNRDWNSIEVGKEYEIVLKFDKKEPWEANATGFKFENSKYPLLYVKFFDAAFLTEFMRTHTLSVDYQGREISRLSLRGSHEAAQEMLNCQRDIEATRSTPKSRQDDPFASSRRSTSVDPFSR